MSRLFSVTYEIMTEESASNGEAEETGFVVQDVCLRDALEAVHETRTSACDGVTSIQPSSSDVADARWITIDNGMEFETGARESRSIHFPESLTGATRCRIARLLGA